MKRVFIMPLYSCETANNKYNQLLTEYFDDKFSYDFDSITAFTVACNIISYKHLMNITASHDES